MMQYSVSEQIINESKKKKREWENLITGFYN